MATATTTVATVIALVKEDLQEQFGSSGSTSATIDWTNRIQQMILQRRRWDWMKSLPKRFITERGQTDYWIGATGSVSAGQVNTGLNLSDVRRVIGGSVLSRTGFTSLHPAFEPPFNYQREDGSYDEGVPQLYRNDEGAPNVISLYPAPDTGSTYELVPPAPNSTTAAGGALAARTYYIRTTFVDLEGNEGAPSPTARQFVEASKYITVKAPQPAIDAGSAGVSYLRWNVYASETEGSETLQNGSPTATSSDWTQSAALTTNGASVPTDSSIEPLRGYVVEFRYWKTHTALTSTSDTLLIPNDFRDVVVSGVKWLALRYLKQFNEAELEHADFLAGIARMVSDQTQPGERKFLRPDYGAYNSVSGEMRFWNPDL